ncbi:MAG: hypothetical protein CVT84_04275 [Alphaproteobacteria bacterium HGW-Alphaproteobacteria-6]|nr:MAG: hypothetical protein CVT84_04275 [Alphaproteobacteria bacterium HGW-Alphaproteobacteria-6]
MFDTSLECLLVHCQGEIGKVVTGGAPEVPGATILDKMNHINRVDDALRRFVSFEPRAHAVQTVNLLLSPCRGDADAAFIVLQADRAHPMSGSNAICVVTALLETGRVKMAEPETLVRLDTAAGLVVARARCENGRCLSVSLDNVAAFVVALDAPVRTGRFGTFTAELIGETMVGPCRAVLPRITGQAWIYGREELRISPDDPFPAGFALSDTWGPEVGDL